MFIVHKRRKTPYEYTLFHNDSLHLQIAAHVKSKGSKGDRSLDQRLPGTIFFTFSSSEAPGSFAPLLNFLNFFPFVFSMSKILRQLISLFIYG